MSNIFVGREFNMLNPRLQDAERVWNTIQAQLNNHNVRFQIAIEGMVFAALDREQIEYILMKYLEKVGSFGMFARDASINRVILAPEDYLQAEPLLQIAGQIPILMQTVLTIPNAFQVTLSRSNTSTVALSHQVDGGSNASPSTKPAKIPRPPNAFILYRKAHHADVVAQNPGLHNNQISVIIGAMWNGESAQVKDDFKAQAEQLKLEHRRQHPHYQYQPRKPSEKKKRMTKKKVAMLAAAKNRAQSLQIVTQYAALPQASQQLVNTVDGTHHMFLPASNLPSASALQQEFQFNPMDSEDAGVELPFDLSPSASYVAAQEADTAFFPDIDQNDPAFQALLKEVGEAYEAGYYDDLLLPSVAVHQPSNFGYQTIDHVD